MVRNQAALDQFELELACRRPVDFRANLAIADGLLEEALAVGSMPRPDPMEGIETIIRVARALNSV